MAKFRVRKPVRRGPLPLRYVWLITLAFFIFSTVIGFWIVNRGVEPILMRYAESQTRNIAALVINNAINKTTKNISGSSDVIQMVPSGNGKMGNAKLNTKLINEVLAETTAEIQKNLRTVEQGDLLSLEQSTNVKVENNTSDTADGLVWYVPLGVATNIALFGNLGPKIPVRFSAIGDITPDVKVNSKPMGINNTWIDVSVQIEVDVQILTPFATKITKLKQTIPVGGSLIQGDVPQFFNGGGSTLPSIQLPKSGG